MKTDGTLLQCDLLRPTYVKIFNGLLGRENLTVLRVDYFEWINFSSHPVIACE